MGTHTQDLTSSVVMSVLIILVLVSPVCIQRLVGILQRQRQTEDLYFTRRCIRTGFCSPDLADFHNLYISSDEKLFNKILTCPNHILRTLLPLPTIQNYSLRNSRPHNRQLPDHISQITDCNFTVRMLYRNMYWLLYILDLRFVLFLCTTAVWQFAINECVMLCYVLSLDLEWLGIECLVQSKQNSLWYRDGIHG